MRNCIACVMVFGGLGVLAGCGEGEAPSPAVGAVATASIAAAIEVVNTRCPIMGNEINAKDLTDDNVRDWNGKKVGFCCPPCLEEWDELSDADKAEKLANPPRPAH